MKIQSITPRMILDSRGYPTVEVDLVIEGGFLGRASVPSGASTGSHEALELRDGDSHFAGKGVQKAISIIRTAISQKLVLSDISSQKELDQILCSLDGTPNKSNLGANTTLAVSLAYAKAVALASKKHLFQYLRDEYTWTKPMSLPVPLVNVLNGGKHSAASTDIQEWMIVPVGATSFSEAIETCATIFYTLRNILAERGESGVGDEGGFPLHNVKSNKDALTLLSRAVEIAGYELGVDVAFAIDVASSEFYNDRHYELNCDKKILSSNEMIEYLHSLALEFPIVSIEDGLAEDDWVSWKTLTKQLGDTIQLVGDDLFVTNTHYIRKGIEEHVANAVLIKPNQIGTISETVEAILLAHAYGYSTIISHRSGETEDVSIAHLAVASGSGQIKIGSFSRTERLAKYNELIRIGEEDMLFYNPYKKE